MNFNEIPEMALEEAPHFALWEVECKDGCGQAIIQPKLVWRLESGRHVAGVQYNLSRWNRCLNHNLLVGGDPDSSHPLGWAVDILLTKNKLYNYLILQSLITAGFPRIKVRPDHIHVDIDPEKRWWILIP